MVKGGNPLKKESNIDGDVVNNHRGIRERGLLNYTVWDWSLFWLCSLQSSVKRKSDINTRSEKKKETP